MNHLGLSLIIWWMFCLNNTVAQNHSYRQYTTDDGLPTNYVYGVIEDDDGYIWAYTENGISKFDGQKFQNYTTADGLPHNDVVYMRKDKYGTLWCRTLGNTATYIEKDSIISIPFQANKLADFLKLEDVVWYGDNQYFYTFQNGSIVDSFSRALSSYSNKHHMLRHRATDSYVGYDFKNRQYLKYEGDQLKTYSIPNLSNFSSFRIFQATDKAYSFDIMMSNTNLYTISKAPVTILDYSWKKIFGINVKHYQGDVNHTDKVLVSTEKGSVFFDKNGTIQQIFRPENISKKYELLRLFIDSQGNYWQGTHEGGLFFFPHQAIRTESLQAATAEDILVEQLFERKGNIYAISDNMRIYRLNDEGLDLIYKHPHKGAFNSMTKQSNGNLFFAGVEKPIIWKNDSNQFVTLEKEKIFDGIEHSHPHNDSLLLNPALMENLKAIAFDDNRGFFFFSWILGTYCYHFNDQITKKIFPQRIDIIEYDTLLQKTYLCHQRELYQYQSDSLKLIQTLPDIITSLYFKNKDKVLIGTQSAGLYEWDRSNDSLNQISKRNYIRAIYLANNKWYLASNKGVIVLREDKQQYQEIYCFDKKDGLLSTEVFDVLTDSTHIYAATMQGVARIKKQAIAAPLDTLQRLHIRHVAVNKEIQDWTTTISLSPKQNNIEINYHLLDYSSLGNIQYQYRLLPIQKNWISTTTTNVYFSDLQANDYKFELKAIDAYGKEYKLSNSVRFNIQKAFWQKLWFQILTMASFLGLLFFIIKKREERQQAKLAYEKSLNDRIAELQMESLRSQMNPHFIFNALGSIQYYIQTARTDEADGFLTMFASLMRRYLDSATERTIDLQSEIGLLEEYTRLEMMRFEEQFDTTIKVENNINIHQEKIPSMLIQPFVENAINHGLQPRLDKSGKLEIRFFRNKELDLVCSISDNGIGRTHAAANKRKNHRSKGMQNVQDRIDTLRANEISLIDIKIEDYNPTNLQFPGTIVTIQINLDHEI